MPEDPTATGRTPVQFPPLPLLSGDTLTDDDGTPHVLAAVTITLTAEDGTTQQIPLEYRYGGWWPTT